MHLGKLIRCVPALFPLQQCNTRRDRAAENESAGETPRDAARRGLAAHRHDVDALHLHVFSDIQGDVLADRAGPRRFTVTKGSKGLKG